MRCSLVLLPLYLDGALDEVQAREVQLHLRECRSCSALIRVDESPWDELPRLSASVLGGMGRSLEVELKQALEDPARLRSACQLRQQPSRWVAAWASGVFVGVVVTWGAARLTEEEEERLGGSLRPRALQIEGGPHGAQDGRTLLAVAPRLALAPALWGVSGVGRGEAPTRATPDWELSVGPHDDALHLSELTSEVLSVAIPHCPLHY